MPPTSPAAARLDLFDLLSSDPVKGTPRSPSLSRIYKYEVAEGTQVRSNSGVVSIRGAQETDDSCFEFTLTVYTDMSKGPSAAEAAMDEAWWAVEQLLDTGDQFDRGLWSEAFVADGLTALVRQVNVKCVRGQGLQSL